jgi:hypothetical protein
MEPMEFSKLRGRLGKTQQGLARLMGTSLKAVHSYEQGWRSIPSHVERQLLFLASMKGKPLVRRTPCWVVRDCSAERRKHCPAWEFQAGEICWFVNGTFCEGVSLSHWQEKMSICRSCTFFWSHFQAGEDSGTSGLASTVFSEG